MNNEPNWLNIEDQLYPEIYISKIIHIDNQSLAQPIHYHTQVLYNSLHRQINVTSAFTDLILHYFKTGPSFEVSLFDSAQGKFSVVGIFPFKDPIILQGAFIQNQILLTKIRALVHPIDCSKPKAKTDKTIKFILQKVAQWRKIHIESQKKITLQQAANMIGISRNTLDDYYFQIKVAEKHGYKFQQNLQEPFQNLRKFVKQNEQKKQKAKQQPSLPNILSKYQLK